MIGRSIGAVGTSGIAVPLQHRHRYRSTRENFRVTAIPRPSSSAKFTNRIIVTSRVMPWCGSMIRRRSCKERPRRRDRVGNHRRKEISARKRIVSAPHRRHTRRALQSLRVRKRRNKEAKRLKDQHRPLSNNGLRPTGESSRPDRHRYIMNNRRRGWISTQHPRIQVEVTDRSANKQMSATQAKGMDKVETGRTDRRAAFPLLVLSQIPLNRQIDLL